MPKQRIDVKDVVESAMGVVDHDGLDELGLARVAADLGVQASALYNHVNGLDGLRQELALQSAVNLSNALRDAAVARSGAAALREVAAAYRTFAHEHPGQYAALLLPAGSAIDGGPAPHAQIVEVLARILESFDITGADAIHGARIVRSAIHGFVALEASQSFIKDQDPDETFAALVEFVVAGFERESGPS